MANVNLGQLNKPGFKTSLGSRSGGSRIVAKSLTKNTSLFSNMRVLGQWGTANVGKANYQNARFALNAGAGAPPRTSGVYSMPASTSVASNFNVQNGSNSFAAGQVVGTGLSMAIGILNKTGVLGNIMGSSTTNSSVLSNVLGSLGAQGVSSGEFYSQMQGAKSFKELNSVEQNLFTKKAALSGDYAKIGTEAKSGINDILGGEGVSDGLKLAGVNIDSNQLDIGTIDPNGQDGLQGCIDQIGKGIENVTKFKESLPSEKAKVSEKAGQVKGELSATNAKLSQLEASLSTASDTEKTAIQSQIDELKSKIKELEQQQKQLESAQKAIDDISSKCTDTIESLKAKQSEVKDMKKAEDGIKDKKYDLAKSQDDELKKTMDKLTKLNNEIKSLGNDPEKNRDKIAKLRNESAGLYSTMSKLIDSLNVAGNQPFVNSKGQSYTIQNLGNAIDMLSNRPADTSSQTTTVPQNGASTGQSVSGSDFLPANGQLPTSEVAAYRDETLRGMSLEQLNDLHTRYTNSGDTNNAARVQKIITERTQQPG